VRCGDQAYRVRESRINDWANAKASGITAGPLFRDNASARVGL
jgi:hypothetical protein